jgi:hypothetical protein
MNQRLLQRLLKEVQYLDRDKKLQLQKILRNVESHVLRICEWVRILELFNSEGFSSFFSFEKERILKEIEAGILQVKKGEIHGAVLRLYMDLAPDSAAEVILERFASNLISALRKEKNIRLKAILAYLLVPCSPRPIKSGAMEDYLWGIHHHEELIRCRMLIFLNDHYGQDALEAVWSEVIKKEQEPKGPFLGNLIALLRSHKSLKLTSRIRGHSLSNGRELLQLIRLEDRKNIPRFLLLPFLLNPQDHPPTQPCPSSRACLPVSRRGLPAGGRVEEGVKGKCQSNQFKEGQKRFGKGKIKGAIQPVDKAMERLTLILNEKEKRREVDHVSFNNG